MQPEKKFCYEYPRPGLTVDLVIFSSVENNLKILLIERGIEPFKACWALPGGFINANETINQAAERELYEETNLRVSDLRQFYVASNPGRDPRGWTISVVFMGFIRDLRNEAIAGDDAKRLKWFSINNLPGLAFDHDQIINKARNTLIALTRNSIIGKDLLPDIFKLSELKSLYFQIGINKKQTVKLIERLIEINAIGKTNKDFYKFDKEICSLVNEEGFC